MHMNRAFRLAALSFQGAVLLLVVLLGGCAPGAVARGAPDSFAPLVKKVLPSVVNIATTETVGSADAFAALPPELRNSPIGRELRRRFGGRPQKISGAGSGFIVDPSGIVVTNNHVIGHADLIVVSLTNGTQLPAKVLGRDELTDIAVLKVAAASPLPAVGWGDSRQMEVGDWIIAAGNPFGLGGSVSAGIISAEGRDLGSGPFDNFIQIDAPINPGNSGGPVFNMAGQVIGVTSTIISPTGASVGIGFAIPSETVSAIVGQLISQGEIQRGWLGVAVSDGVEGGGVLIAGLDPDSPAGRAGIRTGDVLTAVAGERVESPNALIRAIAAVQPGHNVRITVRRQGHDMDIPVTVGRRPRDRAE